MNWRILIELAGEMSLKLNSMINQRQTEFNLSSNSISQDTFAPLEKKNDKKVTFTNSNNNFLEEVVSFFLHQIN